MEETNTEQDYNVEEDDDDEIADKNLDDDEDLREVSEENHDAGYTMPGMGRISSLGTAAAAAAAEAALAGALTGKFTVSSLYRFSNLIRNNK